MQVRLLIMVFTYLTISFLALVSVLGCHQRAEKAVVNLSQSNPNDSTRKPPSSFQDTLVINAPAAVFYYPDTLQLERIRSVTEPQVFDGSMHEYFYLQRNARQVIRDYDADLEIIDARNVRYLLFSSRGLPDTCIDLDLKQDPYGLFIIAPGKKPHPVDMANIDRELPAYRLK